MGGDRDWSRGVLIVSENYGWERYRWGLGYMDWE